MPEIPLIIFGLIIVFSPQIIAGTIARSNGRDFWFWFWISFVIPIISIIILLFLEDKKPNNGHKLADHVKRD